MWQKKCRIRNEHLIGNLWMAPIEGKKKSKNAVWHALGTFKGYIDNIIFNNEVP